MVIGYFVRNDVSIRQDMKMAKLKANDFRNMTEDELKQKILAIKEDLYKLSCERRAGRIEKPHMIGQAKKSLARIYTILKEKSGGRA